jgi:hypothetical protein
MSEQQEPGRRIVVGVDGSLSEAVDPDGSVKVSSTVREGNAAPVLLVGGQLPNPPTSPTDTPTIEDGSYFSGMGPCIGCTTPPPGNLAG